MARFTFAALVAALALAHSAWADCPLGSTLDTAGTTCVCDAGSVGPGYTTTVLQWDTGFCTVEPCPASSTFDAATNNCKCDTYYTNFPAGTSVTYNTTDKKWENSCALATCPANSAPVAGTNVNCTCNTGYVNNPTWNATAQAFDNTCVVAPCPANSTATLVNSVPACACNATFAGSVTWNAATQSYTSTCARVECPMYSVRVGSTCVCVNDRFINTPVGTTITWNSTGQTWTNRCAPIACPGNSTQTINVTTINGLKATIVSCKCNTFFTGNPSFNSATRTWTPVCALAACPAIAQSRLVGQCTCRQGYRPNRIAYDSVNRKWNGTCDLVPVDAASAEFNNVTFTAACRVFFNGSITWDAANFRWLNSCRRVVCPPNSDRAANGNWCNCRPGFPGPPTWDYTKRRFSRGCGAQVACSIANAGYVNNVCTCRAPEYVGQIRWVNNAWSGSCSLRPCDNIRKEWRQMTSAEKNLYFRAVGALSSSSRYDSTLSIHWAMPPATDRYAHQSAGIYPWHRYYLYNYEEALRASGPEFRCVTIPYYDWSADGSGFINASPLSEFGGRTSCLRTMSGVQFRYSGCVSRAPSAAQSVPGSTSVYNAILSGSVGAMYGVLGAAHNAVHNNVGGVMASLQSPRDPFFFMHHGMVDYQWWLWSVCRNDFGSAGLGTVPGYGVSPASIAAPQNSFNGRRGYRYQLSNWARSAGFLQRCPNARNFLGNGASSASSAPVDFTKFDPTVIFSDAGSASSTGLKLQGAQAAEMNAYWTTFKATNDPKAAQKAACTAAGTVRSYNGPSSWAKTMCTQAQEYDAYVLDKDICTTFAPQYLVPTFRAKLAAEDAECNAMMVKMGGRR